LVDKRERAMGFRTSTTTALGLLRANGALCWTKLWIFTSWCGLLVYALQQHHGDHFLSLGAEDSGKGAQWSTFMEGGIDVIVEEAKQSLRSSNM
jgi:hypothetical protein